jgi:3-hydroxyisobutyrate dehydrogenase-like beta-hydroxyacid dehydrogenase
MGAAMAARLLECEEALLIHDIDRVSADPLLSQDARWAPALANLAQESEIVLLSLPGPREVAEVVSGRQGLLETLAPGSVIVDLSTNAIATVRELAQTCLEKGIAFLDSPVSGGSAGARAGTLVLMVGGDEAALADVRPVLDKLSRSLFHLGAPGAGTVAKLVNNQLYLCGEVLFFEGLVLAAKAGLDPEVLCEILDQTGAGGVHARLAPRILERRYDDRTFTLGLAEKDVALVLEASESLEAPMPATAAAHQLFAAALAEGMRDKNFWAAVEIAERRAKVRLSSGNREA